MPKMMTWTDPPRPQLARLAAAAVLRAAGASLDRMAWRLMSAPRRPARAASTLASLEFHAEAGAPEGALYVDGELVARLPGVTRL